MRLTSPRGRPSIPVEMRETTLRSRETMSSYSKQMSCRCNCLVDEVGPSQAIDGRGKRAMNTHNETSPSDCPGSAATYASSLACRPTYLLPTRLLPRSPLASQNYISTRQLPPKVAVHYTITFRPGPNRPSFTAQNWHC